MSSSRDPLSKLLGDWRVEPTADPGFRPAVLARIARTRAEGGWAAYLRVHPALWTAAAVLALAGAAWTGRAAGRAKNRADQALLASTYVRRLDPRAMAGSER